MLGRNREMRWLAGMALAAVLIAMVLLVGRSDPAVAAQVAQTPTGTPTETLGPLTTPTATEEATPLLPMTPTVEMTETPTATRTPMVTPTGAVTPGLPETGEEVGVPRTMIVVGEGRVQASPDIATANIGVTAVATTVVSATQQVSQTMSDVLDALMAQGVAQEDIQTTSYSINLIDGIFGAGQDEDGEQPQRYQVTNSVQMTIRDIGAIGTTMDAAVEAGANQVFGVGFDVSSREELVLQALEEAVQNAEERAQRLATLTGVELGPIVSVSQVIGAQGLFGVAAEAGLGVGGAAPGPISPGQLEIVTQLQVTYALQ